MCVYIYVCMYIYIYIYNVYAHLCTILPCAKHVYTNVVSRQHATPQNHHPRRGGVAE